MDTVKEVAHMVDDGLEFPHAFTSFQIIERVEGKTLTRQGIAGEIVNRFAGHGAPVHKNAPWVPVNVMPFRPESLTVITTSLA